MALVTLLALAGCSSGGGPSSSPASSASSPTSAIPSVDTGPDPSGGPPTAATGVPPAEAAAGRVVVRRYAAAALAVLSGPRSSVVALRRVAAGPALADLLAQRTEYAGHRLRVDGHVRVVRQTVVRRRARPPALTVAACVDTAAVRVRDRTGATVPTSSEPRTLDVLTLDRRAGRWRVVTAAPAARPDC